MASYTMSGPDRQNLKERGYFRTTCRKKHGLLDLHLKPNVDEMTCLLRLYDAFRKFPRWHYYSFVLANKPPMHLRIRKGGPRG
ncbi:MAG: hypothetical protein ACLPSH_16510 [Vulcanimicrobiaceae bacterium]